MGYNAYRWHSPEVLPRCVHLEFGLDRILRLAIRLDLAWLPLGYRLIVEGRGDDRTTAVPRYSDLNSIISGTERARTYKTFSPHVDFMVCASETSEAAL